jgi:hypothetical protein
VSVPWRISTSVLQQRPCSRKGQMRHPRATQPIARGTPGAQSTPPPQVNIAMGRVNLVIHAGHMSQINWTRSRRPSTTGQRVPGAKGRFPTCRPRDRQPEGQVTAMEAGKTNTTCRPNMKAGMKVKLPQWRPGRRLAEIIPCDLHG